MLFVIEFVDLMYFNIILSKSTRFIEEESF